MNQIASIKRPFHVSRRDRGESIVQGGKAPRAPWPGRLPRVTRLLTLAIHFDELLRTGQVESQAELSRLGQVTRPRLTQIMNLLYLEPDIQEQILMLPLAARRSPRFPYAGLIADEIVPCYSIGNLLIGSEFEVQNSTMTACCFGRTSRRNMRAGNHSQWPVLVGDFGEMNPERQHSP